MIRSIGTCGTCFWWRRQGATIAAAVRDPSAGDEVGTCHLFAPTVVRNVLGATAYYPVTHESRFCGDYDPADDDSDGPDDGESEPVPESTVLPFERRAA